MKILHLSDTHGQHNRLPELPWADVIIHSGDFSFGGSKREFIDFLNWFCYLPYKYKIFIARPDTDVLITLCPPFGILDFDNNIHYGSKELLTAVEKIKPRYHLFGHIHANNGIEEHGSTTFINSAIVNEIYEDIQPWHLIEL